MPSPTFSPSPHKYMGRTNRIGATTRGDENRVRSILLSVRESGNGLVQRRVVDAAGRGLCERHAAAVA